MLCPYCHSPLQENTVLTKSDQQAAIYECFTCGGHWSPRWLANDISLSQANNVDSITPQTGINPPESPRCPECQNRLSLIKHDSVPRGLHVYTCPQGHGNFFPKGELIQFKKAQEAKITYHQVWGIPIKSIFAVLLPVALVLSLAVGIPLTTRQVQQSAETRISADEVFSSPIITQIPPDSVSLSFSTTLTGSATITLYQNNQPINTYAASSTPTTIHTTTLKNLVPNLPYTFTITLETATDTIVSKPYSLSLSP